MTRGKNIFSMTEFNVRMPHETVADPTLGNTDFRLDAGTSWLTEAESSPHKCSDCEASRSDTHEVNNQIEEQVLIKRKPTLPKIPANYRISALKNTKIKLQGKVSELLSSRMRERKSSNKPDELPSEEIEFAEVVEQAVERVMRPDSAIKKEDISVRIPEVTVQALPMPTRKRRSAKVDIAPKSAKPLKVIRRRREEAPKVFETAPKDYPKSMLEGIKVGFEEERDNPPK